MKLLIAGSRQYTDYGVFAAIIDQYIFDNAELVSDVVIVHGGAKGIDAMADKYARDRGYEIDKYLADWSVHGRSAGVKRNTKMVNVCDAAILFWDGKSSGTKDTLRKLQNSQRPYALYNVEGKIDHEQASLLG